MSKIGYIIFKNQFLLENWFFGPSNSSLERKNYALDDGEGFIEKFFLQGSEK